MYPLANIDLLRYSNNVKTRISSSKKQLFDVVRKLWINETPEEWVRQLFLHFLSEENIHPMSLVSVEKSFQVFSLNKRWDVVLFNEKAKPYVLCEFKKPEIKINDKNLRQVRAYLTKVEAPFVFWSNGIQHRLWKKQSENSQYFSQDYFPNIKNLPRKSS